MFDKKSKILFSLIEKLLKVDHTEDGELIPDVYDSRNDVPNLKHVHDHLTEESKKHFDEDKNASIDQKSIIRKYSTDRYEPINQYLRSGDTNYNKSSLKYYIDNLKALTKNPTDHTFNVYRTMRGHGENLKRGDTFKDNAFVSTSLKPSISERFKETNSENYRIRIRPGTRGHYLGNDSGITHEKEFLLHPGTVFKVGRKFVHPNGQTYTDLHIHSQEN